MWRERHTFFLGQQVQLGLFVCGIWTNLVIAEVQGCLNPTNRAISVDLEFGRCVEISRHLANFTERLLNDAENARVEPAIDAVDSCG